MTPADPAPIVHGHVCPPTVGSMAMRRQLPGGAEMQGNAYQPTTWRRETLGIAACVSLVLFGFGGGKSADVTLPIDPAESAAPCYGATIAPTQARVGKGSVERTSGGEETRVTGSVEHEG